MTVVTGDQYLRNLLKAGIIRPETNRVVIDAKAGYPLEVFVRQFGTEELLEIDPPNSEIVVHDYSQIVVGGTGGTMQAEQDRRMLMKCLIKAKQSPCLKMNFGAILVQKGYGGGVMWGVNGWRRDGMYNSAVPCGECLRTGIPSGTRLEVCRAVHAEGHVLMLAQDIGLPTAGATMYIAGLYPDGSPFLKEKPGFYCTLCARAMQAAGVATVVVAVKSMTHHSAWEPARMTMQEAWDSAYQVARGSEDCRGNAIGPAD